MVRWMKGFVPTLVLVAGNLFAADKVNVNTASAAELKQLPEMNDARATAIVNYRKSTGEFIQVDEDYVKAKVIIYNLGRSNSRPVAYFESEASGSLDAVWQEIAEDTVEFLERKIRRSEHRANKARERRDAKAKARGEQ